MNYILMSGNLVNETEARMSGDKLYAYNKIGVYNGKNKSGEQRDSMFFDIICFGRDAELLRDYAHKGDYITVAGRLEEDKTTSQDGRLFVNRRIVATNVMMNKTKKEMEAANEAPEVFAADQIADPFA